MVVGRRRRGFVLSGLLLLVAAVLATVGAPSAGAQDGELVGTFRITAGQCGGGASGSYFRMILPTGSLEGPWVDNADSACADRTYTLLTPGTDGGLATGGYQPAPNPGFDGGGNSLAVRVIRPVRFFGVDFSGSTNPTDLQGGQRVPAPTVRVQGGRLSGDLSAFAATWNDQAFNQGSPKPGGGRPGNTTLPTGTYDAATGSFSLTWTSQIVGGPFNNFTGLWHVEGTFVPAGGPAAGGGATATTAPTAGGATASTTPGATVAPGATLAPGATVAPGGQAAAPLASTVIEDEGFEAPVWLVVLLALAGIGGVLTMLFLGPRDRGPGGPGAGARPVAATDAGSAADAPAGPQRRWPLRAMVAIGLGLALAPAVFQMFTRAPGGGEMIDDFAPYMTEAKIDSFTRDLDTIGAASDEAAAVLAQQADGATRYPSTATLTGQWPAIDDDMSSMLGTMKDNIGEYDGVAALPPFVLFPWFFVIPGVLVAGVAAWALRRDRTGVPTRGRRIALIALGVGLIAAPAVFQMFTRAPGGADMIADFKPFMKPDKVTEIQGYFLTIGGAEGDLRLHVLPDAAAAGRQDPTPAISALNEQWARISGEMAPMIGTMADNVDRFAGIAALPPFWLFPWFFVLPGVLVVAFTVVAGRSGRPEAEASPASDRRAARTPALEGA